MPLQIKPNIKIDEIRMLADENSNNVDRFLEEAGRNIPIIKIGDYVLGMGELYSFKLKTFLNGIPKFTISVRDEQYKIRQQLKQDIDKCVVFLGYRDWYVKYNGVLDTTYSDVGDSYIEISGSVYNKTLYEGQQKSFKDMSVRDILVELCKKTNMGLYTFDNASLNQILDYSLMTGTRYSDFFDFVLQNYTDNFYIVDPNYYYHVANIDALRKANVDKYTLDWRTGKTIGEHPLLLKTIVREGNPDATDYSIPIEYYSFNTNFSAINKETYASYSLGLGGNGEKIVASKEGIGIGSNKTNSFKGFEKHKNPFYVDKINKAIGGTSIKVKLNTVVFEICPFSIVDVAIYLPQTAGEQHRLDDEHSGKKIVIGIEYEYVRPDDTKEKNTITQTLDLI